MLSLILVFYNYIYILKNGFNSFYKHSSDIKLKNEFNYYTDYLSVSKVLFLYQFEYIALFFLWIFTTFNNIYIRCKVVVIFLMILKARKEKCMTQVNIKYQYKTNNKNILKITICTYY